MKKLTLFFLFISTSAVAQTHRFIYEYQFKADSTAEKPAKQNMALDINPEEVKFYNYQYVIVDSLNKTRGESSMMWDEETPAVFRKKNSDKNVAYIMMDNLFVMETDDKINWNLSKETKALGNYTLQKATAKFGGRNWTAWFNKEVNLSEGPYKFRGLPGLIFEITDDKNQHHFVLAKSYKLDKTFDTSAIVENFMGQKPIKINEKTYRKMKLESYDNPLRDFKKQFAENTNTENTFWVMGVQVKSADQFKDLTEMSQKRMLKDNNPIELDEAIRYPVLKK